VRAAFIWQRFLPYHVARLSAVARALHALGHDVVAVEVATKDATYGFPSAGGDEDFERRVCFAGMNYHSLSAASVWRAVVGVLRDVNPDVVFAPATPFPEGMAAFQYRLASKARVVMMDDAWEGSEVCGPLTRWTKRIIHGNVDGVFTAAPSHAPYFQGLGFPEDRIFFGVDVVDNDYFAKEAARIRASASGPAETAPYFLFVGRILQRKGLESLLRAYAVYRRTCGPQPWWLMVVGDGPAANGLRREFSLDGVDFVGTRFGSTLCESYAGAGALVVPSLRDPWALVVNEGAASGLPLLVSRGCGSAKTLVRDGENGWTFEPGDTVGLAELMARVSSLSDPVFECFGSRSREIVAEWGLERFTRGAFEAIQIPRRFPAGFLSDLITRSWRGRVRLT
jgi:1,2-diacylglycerol 3-alpha-glucosyltransferase